MMKMLTRWSLLMLLILVVSTSAEAQKKKKDAPAPAPAAAAAPKADTTKRKTGGPQPYTQVITAKAVTQHGLFTVHKVNNDYFFEIADSVIGREFMAVTRIAKAPTGAGYGGEERNRQVLRWEKGPDNKLFLRAVLYINASNDSTAPISEAVRNSNLAPIVASFDIKAINSGQAYVINVTDFFKSDNQLVSLSPAIKRNYSLTTLQADRSYIQGMKSFPINTDVRMVKTYTSNLPPQSSGPSTVTQLPAGASTGFVTVELNVSMIMLPKNPMRKRFFDNRVGFFANGYTVYGEESQRAEREVFAVRWRLEPKPEDVEKMKRGELVEPVKPIVYYIDPTTPKKWVPYLIQGVNDWAVAFEAAGFKNAIVAKEAPTREQDSTWSLEDASHNAIVYKPSTIANASGPSVIDPRSGEIMETHINWYHNVMSLLRNWYMVQTAAVDPEARKMIFSDELMGQLIRFVSSHEVGHTLGLRHNFGSSSTVPVENLRNKAWVEANGHTPSIMDYARFNYVAQPEDNISQKGLFPRIGDYDKWAIEWGYRLFPEFKSPDEETAKINSWTIEKLKNQRLWWGDGEGNRDDPRSQTEDLSDNAMKASSYGIKNLQRIITKLPEYTKMPNEDYEGLREMYSQVAGQFGRYIGHVSGNIGGIERTPKRQEQAGPVYNFTAKAKQKEAMAWLQQNVFTTPTWVIQKEINSLTGIDPAQTIGSLQSRALGSILSPNTFTKLLKAEAEGGTTNYTLTEMMNDLRKGIFSELDKRAPVDIYRRQLQKSFADRIIALVKPAQGSLSLQLPPGFTIATVSPTSDVLSTAKAQLRL
ncbi:MAG: zinc-dependent metalloprotease, partial [Cyclobacteriaceae bacterium]|nr:zinc-dependent metalloprotease [Cyclobacteriaceae bacterium]